MNTPTVELARRAMALMNAAPREWEMFLGAVSAMNTETTTHCIQSTIDELPRAQGRAQMSALLLSTLANCRLIVEKSERK